MKRIVEIISVIVPIYNVEKYVRNCLLSIIHQTFTTLDIILVDDGSTDNYMDYIKDIIKEDKRIRIFHKENGGLSSARNYGIKKARGNYVVFIDSDDTVDSRFIELLYESIRRNNAEIAMCGIRINDYVYEDNYVTFDVPPTDYLEELLVDKHEIWNLFYNNNKMHSFAITVAWNKIYKKGLFNELLFPEGRIFEDEFLIYQIYDLCNKISIISDPLYSYKMNRKGSLLNINNNDEKKRLTPLIYRSIYFIKNGFKNQICLKGLDKYIYCYYYNYSSKDKEFNGLVWTYYFYVIRKINHKFLFNKHLLRLFLAPFRVKRKGYSQPNNNNFCKHLLIGTPNHGNLGDQAIAESTTIFLNDLHYNFSEISIRDYYKFKDDLIKTFPETILLQGGGNMGNNWFEEERLRWDVILSFPNTKIIILPQTVFFEGRYNRETCIATMKKVYCSHKKLVVFAREKRSYEILKSYNIKVKLAPDMVLYNIPIKRILPKNKVIMVISRKDKEKYEGSSQKMMSLINYLKNNSYTIMYVDTVLNKDIHTEERNEVLTLFLSKFNGVDLVITDRLHGMIFSYITNTPSIVFRNYNYKIDGTYDIIKNNNVLLANDLDDIQIINFINDLFLKEKTAENVSLQSKFEIIKKELL